MIPLPGDGAWVLQDAPGAELPLKMPELEAWELLSVSGGDPVRVFGEWNGNELRVLSLWAGKFHGFDSNSAGGGFAPAPPGSSFRPSRPKKLSHWTDMTSAALIGIGRGQAAFDLPGRFAELLQVPEPESRLLRRIIARLELCIRDERKRPTVAFEPPVAFAADWKNDGLEEKPPAALKAGERAWWLFQLAAYAPLSWWENRFQLPPKDILELISKSEWKEALLGGFRSAMANQPGHPGWALALLEQGGLPDREAVLLAGTLPPSDADSALRHILRKTDDSMLAAEMIEMADFPWSGELWSLAKQKLSRWLAQEDWRFRNALTLLACRIPASSLREEVSFPDSSIFSDAIADFSRIQEQRKQLHQLLPI